MNRYWTHEAKILYNDAYLSVCPSETPCTSRTSLEDFDDFLNNDREQYSKDPNTSWGLNKRGVTKFLRINKQGEGGEFLV